MEETVLFEERERSAAIVLNRPDRHHSLGLREIQAILEIARYLESCSSIAVVVLKAAPGPTFCAGAALDEMKSGRITGEMFQSVTNRVAALPQFTVCAVSGNVFGGGAELAMSCDYRLGIGGLTMRVPAAAIGLCYPIEGVRRFVERLGPVVAKRVLLMAEAFSDEQLMEIGFLQELCDVAALASRCAEIVEQVSQLAPLSVRAMKSLIDMSTGGARFDWTRAEQVHRRCLESRDLQEGLAAAAEKRKPVFTGV